MHARLARIKAARHGPGLCLYHPLAAMRGPSAPPGPPWEAP